MRVKAVVTRNFKKTKPGKFCVCRFGEEAELATEVESVDLFNAQITSTYEFHATRDFEDFGCGTIAIGEVDEAVFGVKECVVRFNMDKFEDEQGRNVNKADRMSFGPAHIIAHGPQFVPVNV